MRASGKRKWWIVAGVMLSVACGPARPVRAEWTYRLVAGIDTLIPPDELITFLFQGAPSTDGEQVVFWGEGLDREGLYLEPAAESPLELVADTYTVIPGATETFEIFSDASAHGGTVAFAADGSSASCICTYAESTLAALVDSSTPIPGGTGTFATFGRPSIRVPPEEATEPIVAFTGYGSVDGFGDPQDPGVYIRGSDGTLTTVADLTTAIPDGTGNFTGLDALVSLSGEEVAFRGFGSFEHVGVYASNAGSLDRVADLTMLAPGGTELFVSLGPPTRHGAAVAFWGQDESERQGIYSDVGGSLDVVVDTSTPMPDAGGNFTAFGFGAPTVVTFDGGNVVFEGWGPAGQEGIFVASAPASPGSEWSVTKVIAEGDELDGKTVSLAAISQEALTGDRVAFLVFFDDLSTGVYVAEAVPVSPEPIPASTPWSQAFLATSLLLAATITVRRRRVAIA